MSSPKRWQVLVTVVIGLLALFFFLWLITERPESPSGYLRQVSPGVEAPLPGTSNEPLPMSGRGLRPRDQGRERARLLKNLDKALRQLEYGRIIKTTAGRRSIQLPEVGRSSYGLKEGEETPLNLRSVAVRAPDESEAEAIRKLIAQTFGSSAFEGEEQLENKKQHYLYAYLHYPKKLKVLNYRRLELARTREGFSITSYNSDEAREMVEKEGSNLNPVDVESDREDIPRLDAIRRYQHLFDLKE